MAAVVAIGQNAALMQAIDILMAEHRDIEKVLRGLLDAVARAKRGEGLSLAGFEEAARFVKGFADGLHHEKEEHVLFTAMNDAGMPSEGGPIGMMLYEHDVGRNFMAELRAAAEALRAGRTADVEPLLVPAEGYAQLLAQHIMKEDRILYPMSMQLVSPQGFEEILRKFSEIDAGHEGKFSLAAEAAARALGSTAELIGAKA